MKTTDPEPQAPEPQAPRRRPEVLISEQEIARRIDELTAEIQRDYRDSERLVAIGVLTGSIFFLVDLLHRLDDLPVQIDFFKVSSYGDSTEPGEVQIRKDIDTSIRGADVLLIEDIVDTGYTLRTILDLLRFRGAKSVKLCALLDKEARREVEVPIDYRGFSIEDHFVIGYGLDYAGRYRNLPYVGLYDPDAED